MTILHIHSIFPLLVDGTDEVPRRLTLNLTSTIAYSWVGGWQEKPTQEVCFLQGEVGVLVMQLPRHRNNSADLGRGVLGIK